MYSSTLLYITVLYGILCAPDLKNKYPLCGGRISRNTIHLHIFKTTSLGINCMDKFLPMVKENKTSGLFYTILVTLRQQVF
jgi:hypothetical protein